MMKLILIVLLAVGGWYVYNNWSDLTSSFMNAAQQEKTVQAVGGTRGELNSEAEAAME